jgi:hypothetical protein
MTGSPAAGTPAPPRQWWLISGRRGRLCALAAVAILLAFWGAMASFGPGGVAALRHRLSAGSGRGSVPPALAGRLGDTVASFDRRYLLAGIGVESHAAGDAYRRVYMIPEGRVVAEVLPDGRIRQLTIGRLRHVQQTWEPEAGDWSLQEARQIAVRWLPADAVVIGSEPFPFQGSTGGVRDLYQSNALARMFDEADYRRAAAMGPPGRCTVTYYQTSEGGVAFALVGLG